MSRQAALQDQLRAYEPSDALEAGHVRRLVNLLTTSAADPFSRAHFTPGHVTASCFIVDGAGRLLLHHHRRLDLWLQMGGHLEGDESPLAAALRESREESGLDDLTLAAEGIFDVDVHPIPAGRGEPDHDHFDVRYLARAPRPDAITPDPGESHRLAWFELERAASLMPADSIRVIRKLRERSLS